MDNKLLIEAFVEHYLNEDENSNRKRNKKGFWKNLFAIFQDDIIELYHNRKASPSVIFNYLKLSLSKCCDKKIVLENFINDKTYLSEYLNKYLTSLEVLSKDDTPRNDDNARYIPKKNSVNTKPLSKKTPPPSGAKKSNPVENVIPAKKSNPVEKTKYSFSFFTNRDNMIAFRKFLGNRSKADFDFVDLIVDFFVLDYFEDPSPKNEKSLVTLFSLYFWKGNYVYKSNTDFKELNKIFSEIKEGEYTMLNFKDGKLNADDVTYKFLLEVEKRKLEDILPYKDKIDEIISTYGDDY